MSTHSSFTIDALTSGASDALWFRGTTQTAAPSSAAKVLFAGSFNPLHDGHIEIARLASEVLGTVVCYEISIRNVDKPDLTATEITERLERFPPDARVVVTRAMKFVEKSQLFPNATFVVGADTIRRIADPRYVAGNKRALMETIDTIARNGCRFLVFGRLFDGDFQELAGMKLPDSLLAICQGVDQSRFRCDISSTKLRQNPPH